MARNTEIPSKVFDRAWIWAKSDPFEKQDSNQYSGKWMIFPSLNKLKDGLTILDHIWIKIQEEVYKHKFYKASARTAVETFLSDPVFGVICVHTIDYRRTSDVILTGIKIQLILNSMNAKVCKVLAYKTYEETLKGSHPGPNLYEVAYSDDTKKFLLRRGITINLTNVDLSLLPNALSPNYQHTEFLATRNALKTIIEKSKNMDKKYESLDSESKSDNNLVNPDKESIIEPDNTPKIEPDVTPQKEPKDTPQIEPDDTPRIEPDDTPRIEPDDTPQIEPNVSPKIEPDDTPQIEPDVTSQIEPDVALQIEPDVAPQIEPDVRPQIEPDVTSQIEPDVTPQIEPDVTPQIEPDETPQIEPDETPQIEPDETPQIEPDETPQIEPDDTPKKRSIVSDDEDEGPTDAKKLKTEEKH